MTTSIATKTHTDSTDRTPALLAAKAVSVQQPKTSFGRFGSTARRLLNTLMRSLANPHV